MIRHGEAIYGDHDGLTELGLKQAEFLAARLASMDLAGIFSSTMARARQTAERVAEKVGLPIIFDDRFREIDSGNRQTLSPEERRDRASRYLTRKKVYRLDYSHQNGESPADLYSRAVGVLDDVFPADRRASDQTCVVVAHGGFINAALCYFVDRSFDGWMRFRLGNTSISRVSLVGDSKLVLGVNDLAHLDGLGS